MRFCSANGGRGTSNFSMLLADKLGCAVPFSYFLIYCLLIGDFNNQNKYVTIFLSKQRIIANDDAIAPLFILDIAIFPRDPLRQ